MSEPEIPALEVLKRVGELLGADEDTDFSDAFKHYTLNESLPVKKHERPESMGEPTVSGAGIVTMTNFKVMPTF